MSDKSIWATRHTLLSRISDPDDQRSWDEFITQYERFVYSTLLRFGLNGNEADDLRQMIFIKIWEIMPTNPYDKNKGKFRNWFTTVIKNEVLAFLKQQSKRRHLLEENKSYVKEQVDDRAQESGIHEIITAEWENHLLVQAWTSVKAELKEPAKTVFELAMEGKTNSEISESCEINENTVRTYKKRVKDLMKDAIESMERD